MVSTLKIKGIDYSRKTQTRREVFSRAQRRYPARPSTGN